MRGKNYKELVVAIDGSNKKILVTRIQMSYEVTEAEAQNLFKAIKPIVQEGKLHADFNFIHKDIFTGGSGKDE